jgi:hypothetical protein
MLYRETIAIYSEKSFKYIFWAKIQSLLMLRQVVHVIAIKLWRVKEMKQNKRIHIINDYYPRLLKKSILNNKSFNESVICSFCF